MSTRPGAVRRLRSGTRRRASGLLTTKLTCGGSSDPNRGAGMQIGANRRHILWRQPFEAHAPYGRVLEVRTAGGRQPARVAAPVAGQADRARGCGAGGSQAGDASHSNGAKEETTDAGLRDWNPGHGSGVSMPDRHSPIGIRSGFFAPMSDPSVGSLGVGVQQDGVGALHGGQHVVNRRPLWGVRAILVAKERQAVATGPK